MKNYGIIERSEITEKTDLHIESIKLKGYSIEKEVIPKNKCEEFCSLLDVVYSEQKNEFNEEKLKRINELDIARMPFLFNKDFFSFFMNPLFLKLSERILGKKFHLHLQNGIINRANQEHHQASWHRDLPYQDWVCSKALGFNAFFCLTDFTENNGATFFLPFSHKLDHFPSNRYV